MKKIVAIFLALILMCSTVAGVLTVSADNTNLWTNITKSDVIPFGDYGSLKTFDPVTGTLVLQTIRYQAVYVKMPTLKANTTYQLSMSYNVSSGENQSGVKILNATQLEPMKQATANTFPSNTVATVFNSGASGSNDSCIFTTGTTTDYYMAIRCNGITTLDATLTLSGITLVEMQMHDIEVENGTANPASAKKGTTITVTADEPAEGMMFDCWEVVSGDVTLANASAATTTFTMPEEAVKIKAVYKTDLLADWADKDISDWFGTKATKYIPKGAIETSTSDGITRVKVSSAWYTCWYFKLPEVETNKMYKLSFKYTNSKQDRDAQFQEIKLATLADVDNTAASDSGMVSKGTTIASNLELDKGDNVYTKFSCEFDSNENTDWVLFFNNKDKYCHTAYFTDFSLIEVDSNSVTVEGGSALVNESAVTKASVGTTVTVTANEPAEGMMFDYWEVVSGTITLADSSAATTTFTMPNEPVTLRAVYRDAGAKIDYVTPDGTAYADKANLPKAKTEITETSATSHTVKLTYDTMDQINQFLGWYQGDTLLGTELTYTYDPTALDITIVTAKILCRNVLTGAAGFESYDDLTDMRVQPINSNVPPHDDKWGLNNGNYENEPNNFYIRTTGERQTTYLTDVGYNRETGTYYAQDQMKTAKYTATPHSGDSMLELSISGRAFVRKLDGLKPNTNYTLSFYVMNPDEYNFLTSAVVMDTYTEKFSTLQVMSNRMIRDNKNKIYGFYEADRTEELFETNYTLTDQSSVRDWQKISFTFTTGNSTESLYLYLTTRSRNQWWNRCATYVDDLVCYENAIPYVANAMRATSATLPQALRYKFRINNDFLADYHGNTFKKLGLLVMPTDYLDGAELELGQTYSYQGSNKKPINAPVEDKNYQYVDNDAQNTYFTAALSNIGKTDSGTDYTQFDTAYTVRPYSLYTDESGAEFAIYGDPVTVSVFDVVYAIRDQATSQTDLDIVNGILELPDAKTAYAAWQPANGWNIQNKNAPTDYDYSFAVVGDIQYTTEYYPKDLAATYDWILNNQTSKKIEYVFGTGDITNRSTQAEYDAIDAQLQRLQGKIPQTVIRGNHDTIVSYDKNITQAKYKDGGEEFVSYDTTMKTYYRKITISGIKYMMLTLDYFPSEAEVAWAREQIDKNKDYNVILTTHGYLDNKMTLIQDDKVYDVDDRLDAEGNMIGGKGGQYIYDNLVLPCSNIVMVICGHELAYGPEYNVLTREDGSTAVQMLVNFQQSEYLDLRSYGMIAMLYFSNGGETVTVEWYSSIKNEYYMDKYQFTFDLSVIK